MGGRIWVDSEVGQGSRFSFVAHFGVQQGADGTSGASRVLRPRRSAGSWSLTTTPPIVASSRRC
jgi:hypothetical protein